MTRFALVALFCLVPSWYTHATLGLQLPKRSSDGDFFDPAQGGGSWLTSGDGTSGEPLNVVISAQSSGQVLTDDGFLNFAQALGFSTECLGIHIGGPQTANLGDGNGNVAQDVELRQELSSILGTCLESAFGGNHFRVYRQNGTDHPTGALFLAVSVEEGALENHTIAPNGYDEGRDKLVQAALANPSHKGVSYKVTEQDLAGHLKPGSQGINHGIAIDGVVKLLTVTIQ